MPRPADGNTYYCEACDTWISPGNVQDHNAGRRHQNNVRRDQSRAMDDDDYVSSSSRHNPAYQHHQHHHHQHQNHHHHHHQHQHHQNQNHHHHHHQRQHQHHQHQNPHQNQYHSSASSAVSSVAPQQHRSVSEASSSFQSNNNNTMMMMNNNNSTAYAPHPNFGNQPPHQQINHQQQPNQQPNQQQHHPGVNGGDMSYLCNTCSRLCSVAEVSRNQCCPGCQAPAFTLKQVFVSHHSPVQSTAGSSAAAFPGSSASSTVSQNFNNNNNNQMMMMMPQPQPQPQQQQQRQRQNNQTQQLTWNCEDCTFSNPSSSVMCAMCGYCRDIDAAGGSTQQRQQLLLQKQKGVALVDDDDANNNNNSAAAMSCPSAVCSKARLNANNMMQQIGGGGGGGGGQPNRGGARRNYPGEDSSNTAGVASASSSSSLLSAAPSSPRNMMMNQDVNSIMVEMDEKDTMKCVLCLNSLPTHHFKDCSCENTILCSACAVDVLRKFRPATDQEIDYEQDAAKKREEQKRQQQRQNNRNSNNNTADLRVPDPKVLRCFVCCRLSKAIVASPINPTIWRAPPNSTYPWIGGDESGFDKFVNEILAAGKFFIREQVSSQFATKDEFEANVRIDQCRWITALQKFKRGWMKAKCPEGAWSGVFGWHGTERSSNKTSRRRHRSSKPGSAIFNIAKHNFDPTFRRVNNHNPGEYFSCHWSQSLEYAKNSNTMVLAFILRGKHFTVVEDFAYICNNKAGGDGTMMNSGDDDDDDLMSVTTSNSTRTTGNQDAADRGDMLFCLPIFLVHFNKQLPLRKWSVPRFPYLRWQIQWQNDEETDFIAYDHAVNSELNKQFCLYHANFHLGDQNPYITHIAKCFNMETQEENEYCINFRNYTQTNVETDFLRKINVVCVPAIPLPKTLWIMRVLNPDYNQQQQQLHNQNNQMMMMMPQQDASLTSHQHQQLLDQHSFWTVVDMYAQRDICDAYFEYQKAKKIGDRNEIERRKTRNLTIWGKLHCVDVDRFKATLLNERNQLTGFSYPLAIVDS